MLFDAQPATKTASVLTEATAMTNSTPTLRSVRNMPLPKGITAITARAGRKISTGPTQNSALSALRLVIASFRKSLIVSAMGCSSPCGPTLFGPILDCIRPMTRRSIQMKASWLRITQSRIATTPMSPDTT